jgi:hypothetical protein
MRLSTLLKLILNPFNLLIAISIPWSLLYHHTLVQTLLTTPLIFILRDFLFSSCLIATFLWALTNKLLLSSPTHSNASSDRVEWAFAFDVAVNSFFTFSLSIYVGQLLLSGIIMREYVSPLLLCFTVREGFAADPYLLPSLHLPLPRTAIGSASSSATPSG